ncbi:MAG: hypothetical protein P8X79_21115, partial [Reinekea sp.]
FPEVPGTLIFPIGFTGYALIQHAHKPTDIAQARSPLVGKVINNLTLGIAQSFVIEILANQLIVLEWVST